MRVYWIFCLILSVAQTSFAVDPETLRPAIRDLRIMSKSPDLIKLILEESKPITIRELLILDQKWRMEPQIEDKILSPKAQTLLMGFMAKNNSVFVEMIIMGSQGETLGAIPKTSDYWQGDEAKFQQVMGHGDVFIDALNWDESSQTISAQISVPVLSSGEIIGVITGAVEASLKALSNTEIAQ